MKESRNNVKGWKGWLRSVWLPVLAAPLAVAAWVGYASYVIENGMPVADDGSWSSGVLADLHEGIVTASPIPVANACGLGASSCFKCHNGKRAAEPATKEWHTQHDKVNHSCVGCHKGNERLMLKNMAHKQLIADPRDKAEDTCMSCHDKGDVAALLGKYPKAQ